MDSVDLLQCRNILPPEKLEPPKIKLHQEFLDQVNCSPEYVEFNRIYSFENNILFSPSSLQHFSVYFDKNSRIEFAAAKVKTTTGCSNSPFQRFIRKFLSFKDKIKKKLRFEYFIPNFNNFHFSI